MGTLEGLYSRHTPLPPTVEIRTCNIYLYIFIGIYARKAEWRNNNCLQRVGNARTVFYNCVLKLRILLS